MPSTKFSDRIKQAKSTNKDIEAITQKLEKDLKITDEPVSSTVKPEVTAEVADEDDWEKLADKELDAPAPKPKPKAVPAESPILELYDFDPRLQMHQLVKDFTSIVDPTGTMLFRQKMVGQSLMFTFNNPKHATTALYNYSCITPQDPIGKLRRSDGTQMSRSSSSNSLPPPPAVPARIRSELPSSRPLKTDTVARRFIAGHLGIKASVTPERREYDKLVRTQAQQMKEERRKQLEKEKEDQRRLEEERRNVWEE